jgi:hypothetical protein
MGESEFPTLLGVVVVGALLWARFYLWPKKSKFEKAKDAAKQRELEARGEADWQKEFRKDYEQGVMDGTIIEVPPLDPAEPYHDMFEKKILYRPPGDTGRRPSDPMGPSAPTGLPPMPPPVPLGGRVGPEYLTGQIKAESEEALALIREYFPHEQAWQVTNKLPSPDWDLLYRMAADLLGAVRWYPKVVNRSMNDEGLAPLLLNDPINLISSHIDWYRKSVPPGPDLDQALGILGFYLRNIQNGAEYADTAWCAYLIARLSLDNKVVKEKQAAGGAN